VPHGTEKVFYQNFCVFPLNAKYSRDIFITFFPISHIFYIPILLQICTKLGEGAYIEGFFGKEVIFSKLVEKI
jgi:hypothetical protein